MILNEGHAVPSRNGRCHELIGVSVTFNELDNMFLCNPIRKLSPYYAAAEYLWYMSRTNSTKMIEAYAPSYHRFAEDDGTAHGAYGARLFVDHMRGIDQFNTVASILRSNPDSRQAIVELWRSTDLQHAHDQDRKDLPCTLAWQFLVRDDTLHMVCYMRSNDIWLGFPYDVFVNSCVMRTLAGELNLRLGTYTHNVGSLHLYDSNLDRANEVLTSKCFVSMPVATAWTTPDTNYSAIVASMEEQLMRTDDTYMMKLDTVGDMCRDFLCLCEAYCRKNVQFIESPALRYALYNQVNA